MGWNNKTREILGFAEDNITGYIANILNPYQLYQTSKCTYAQPQAYADVAASECWVAAG